MSLSQKLKWGNSVGYQEHYEECIRNGCSPLLAEMFASRKTPAIRTDATFLQGHINGNQFEKTPWLGDVYKKEAVAAGINITGKVYLSQLASYPGDPQAWVSGRGDVQRVCEERGWGCAGSVNVRAQEADTEPKDMPVADDIVDARTAEVLAGVPDPMHVDVADLREQVREHITPHWSK